MAGESAQDRLDWVDAAKGVGMLLVIIAHVWTRGPVRDAIYAFHMPLFFLLSGYLVRPQPQGRLIARQARSLLLPFASFSLLLIATDFLIEGARGHRPIFADWGDAIWTILARTERTRGPFTILWFVPCLFAARLLWNAIARKVPDAADWRWPAVILPLILFGAVLAAASGASPLGLLGVPAALAMVWAGQLWREHPPGQIASALLGAGALATLLCGVPVNLKTGDYGVALLSLAGAAATGWSLCGLLRLLPPLCLRPLALIGQASLVLMYVHVAFIHYGAPYLAKAWLPLFALSGSLAVYWLARASRAGRTLLLGQG